MKNKNLHYEFTEEKIEFLGRTLHRIKAIKDLPLYRVEFGDLGGFIEKYENLQDSAWVGDEAMVFDNALVSENAIVYENSNLYDSVEVRGHSKVFGNAVLYGDALICGYSEIQSKNDLCTFSYFSKNSNTITFFNTKGNIIGVNYGFFYGTVEEFIEEIKENYDDKFIKECLAIIEVVKIKFNIKIS